MNPRLKPEASPNLLGPQRPRWPGFRRANRLPLILLLLVGGIVVGVIGYTVQLRLERPRIPTWVEGPPSPPAKADWFEPDSPPPPPRPEPPPSPQVAREPVAPADELPAAPPPTPSAPPDPAHETLSAALEAPSTLYQRSEPLAGQVAQTEAPVSRWRAPTEAPQLAAGTLIPAVLINGLESGVPGVLLAQVSQDVRDSRHGAAVLIPQGARLLGRYGTQTQVGQARMPVVWDRILFPNGSTLELGGMPGVDAAGLPGFQDRRNRHLKSTWGNALLLSVMTAGAQVSQPAAQPPSGPGAWVAGALGLQAAQLGSEFARDGLQRRPTLQVRPGYAFHVLVTEDLALPEWTS